MNEIIGFTRREKLQLLGKYFVLAWKTIFVPPDMEKLRQVQTTASSVYGMVMMALAPSKELVADEVAKKPMMPFGVENWVDTVNEHPSEEEINASQRKLTDEIFAGNMAPSVWSDTDKFALPEIPQLDRVTNLEIGTYGVDTDEAGNHLLSIVKHLDMNKFYFIWMHPSVPVETVAKVRDTLQKQSKNWLVFHGPQPEFKKGAGA